MTELESHFIDVSRSVDAALDRLVPAGNVEPERLHEAIRWSLFGAGKRFRPTLLMAVGKTFGASDVRMLNAAAAVEMIHTYSLIHDDLPAMDNDDLRRGRATVHKKFDEATAILAGDALQVLAFQAIADDENLDVNLRLKLISDLARASARMVAGQQMDLEAEGMNVPIIEIENIHANKTGALISFSANAGALLGGANECERATIEKFAEKLGLLFQITDDVLDVTQSTATLGKTAAKDLSAHKATYPSIFGVEGSQKLQRDVHAAAIERLEELARPSDLLVQIADFILQRES